MERVPWNRAFSVYTFIVESEGSFQSLSWREGKKCILCRGGGGCGLQFNNPSLREAKSPFKFFGVGARALCSRRFRLIISSCGSQPTIFSLLLLGLSDDSLVAGGSGGGVGGLRLGVDVDDVSALVAVEDRAAVGVVLVLDVLLGAEQPAAGGGVEVDGGAAVQDLLDQETVTLLCNIEMMKLAILQKRII